MYKIKSLLRNPLSVANSPQRQLLLTGFCGAYNLSHTHTHPKGNHALHIVQSLDFFLKDFKSACLKMSKTSIIKIGEIGN